MKNRVNVSDIQIKFRVTTKMQTFPKDVQYSRGGVHVDAVVANLRPER